MGFLSATVGRVFPKYRTFGEWSVTYRQIVDSRDITPKTKANRYANVTKLVNEFADRTISSIKPHEVSTYIRKVSTISTHSAKRQLQEIRDIFNEAINYGWLDRNPALQVKSPTTKVQRKRLTFDQWNKIYEYSKVNQPPWVSRMILLSLLTGQRRSDVAEMKFTDVWDGYLHIEQAKTGARVAIPLDLRMNVLDITVGDVINMCKDYCPGDTYLIRKSTGDKLVLASLSARFEEARENSIDETIGGLPPSLHECRSLSERIYREQGINTMVLLGHKHQSMTDMYNDDRGLSNSNWKTLQL